MTSRTAAALALALACACQRDPTQVYRVVVPLVGLPGDRDSTLLLPEACYQPDDLPEASVPEQQAAESFCAVGKRPAMGSTSTNLLSAEEWIFFDNGQGDEYLVRPGLAVSGRRQGNQLVFETSTTTFAAVCPGPASTQDAGIFNPTGAPQVMVCDGKCVNINADPGHCGGCNQRCPSGFACTFGRCQQGCSGGFFTTCGGRLVDTSSDRDNCGQCDNPCPPGTVCAPLFAFMGPGQCVKPCEAVCSAISLSEGCGRPAQVDKETTTLIELTLSGDALTGQLTQGVTYACLDGGCAVDFSTRCPSCAVAVPVNGRLVAQPSGSTQK